MNYSQEAVTFHPDPALLRSIRAQEFGCPRNTTTNPEEEMMPEDQHPATGQEPSLTDALLRARLRYVNSGDEQIALRIESLLDQLCPGWGGIVEDAQRQRSTGSTAPPPHKPSSPPLFEVLTPEHCLAFLRGEPTANMRVRYAPLVLPRSSLTLALKGKHTIVASYTASLGTPKTPQPDAAVFLRTTDLLTTLAKFSTTGWHIFQQELLLLWIPPEQPQTETIHALLQRGYGGPGVLLPVPTRDELNAEEASNAAQ